MRSYGDGADGAGDEMVLMVLMVLMVEMKKGLTALLDTLYID